jgi:hypothetical protein
VHDARARDDHTSEGNTGRRKLTLKSSGANAVAVGRRVSSAEFCAKSASIAIAPPYRTPNPLQSQGLRGIVQVAVPSSHATHRTPVRWHTGGR